MKKRAFTLLNLSRLGLMLVAFLAMLAVAETASAAPGTLSLSDFVIFSGGGATENSRSNYETWIGGHTTVNGNIGSNQDLFQQGNPVTGYPAQLNGSAYVGGYLSTGSGLTVGSSLTPREIVVNGANAKALPDAVEADFLGKLYGNMFVTGQATGTTVDLGSALPTIVGNVQFTGGVCVDCDTTPATGHVTGTVTSPSTKTFSLITMPAATSFTASSNPVDSRSCTTGCSLLTLGPGKYNTLTVGVSKTLSLSSGNYYFNAIDAGGSLTLNIDLSSGQPINIYVVGQAQFGSSNTLMVKGAGTGGIYLPISQAQSLASLIYFETHDQFIMGGGSDSNPNIWGGTVYASVLERDGLDEVQIGQYQDWYGAAYAFDSMSTADHGHWTYVPLAVPEPATMLLLGLGLVGLQGFARKKTLLSRLYVATHQRLGLLGQKRRNKYDNKRFELSEILMRTSTT